MSKKRANKIDEAITSFGRWRAMMGITQDRAAELLGKGRRIIQAYERPDPKTGKQAVPAYTDRVVMDMLAKKQQIVAWPE